MQKSEKQFKQNWVTSMNIGEHWVTSWVTIGKKTDPTFHKTLTIEVPNAHLQNISFIEPYAQRLSTKTPVR